jgi:hypothetical protein
VGVSQTEASKDVWRLCTPLTGSGLQYPPAMLRLPAALLQRAHLLLLGASCCRRTLGAPCGVGEGKGSHLLL